MGSGNQGRESGPQEGYRESGIVTRSLVIVVVVGIVVDVVVDVDVVDVVVGDSKDRTSRDSEVLETALRMEMEDRTSRDSAHQGWRDG